MKILLLTLALLFPQSAMRGPILSPPPAAAPSGPAYVNSGGDFSGASSTVTTSFSPANGDTLLVWVVTASTASVTLADGQGTGNTYTADCDTGAGAGFGERGKLFRASNISGSGTYALTVTGGTTPLIAYIEISGNRTADVTCSVLAQGAAGNLAPTGITTVTTNTILIDAMASLTGSTITLSQTDAGFTTRQSALNGSTSFVGAVGTRVVSATGTYTDGWTATLNSDSVAVHIAYK